MDKSDKSGLKVPYNKRIRQNIHKKTDYRRHKISQWPETDYFEIISLAQHYGLPTGALDWSYDYKIALYFAVISVMDNKKEEDCILWALNYKKFEDNYMHSFADYNSGIESNVNLHFYRAEYNSNPNLKAQKGLFTIWIDDENNRNNIPLDKKIKQELDDYYEKNIEEMKKYNQKVEKNNKYLKLGAYEFSFNNNEKIMYKFIIPKEIKGKILNELYIEGYSEEHLFPGYAGVTSHIENKAKLDKILKK